MRIQQDIKLDFSDVLLVPQRSDLSSRSEVQLEREFTFAHSPQVWKGIPIIAANMSATGTFAMAKRFAEHKMLVALHKHYTAEQIADFYNKNPKSIRKYTFYTVGIDYQQELAKIAHIRKLLKDSNWPWMVNCDVPNGYVTNFVDAIKSYRDAIPEAIMLAGNVVTPNMAEELILSGVDIAKVGIGSGKMCTTRIKTACGFPQLSAIHECAFAAHGKPSGHVCSDGGCTTSGDVAKAFAAGADFVMIGGMFAGSDECEGEWRNGKLLFYGMSSFEAQKKYNGGVRKYRASEGRAELVDAKGPVDDIIQDILGGLRSCCTYVGARKLKHLPKCAEFIKVNKVHYTL